MGSCCHSSVASCQQLQPPRTVLPPPYHPLAPMLPQPGQVRVKGTLPPDRPTQTSAANVTRKVILEAHTHHALKGLNQAGDKTYTRHCWSQRNCSSTAAGLCATFVTSPSTMLMTQVANCTLP
jgi:hypothetical protein